MTKNKKHNILDLFGISASVVCALHCSLLPLAIASGLLGSQFLSGHGIIEYGFIVISLCLAFASLYKSYATKHGRLKPLMTFGTGIILILIGLNFHGPAEIVLATSGGMIIAYAHLINIRLNGNLKAILS